MSSAYQGPTSTIKSIQRGVITLNAGQATNVATVTAVVTAKTAISFLGMSTSRASAYSTVQVDMNMAHVALTSTTVVTATFEAAVTGGSYYLGFCLTEYN